MGHPKLIEMPWERLVAVLANVERMAERMQRTPYLYITGGDPILHSRFWDFLELVLVFPFRGGDSTGNLSK